LTVLTVTPTGPVLTAAAYKHQKQRYRSHQADVNIRRSAPHAYHSRAGGIFFIVRGLRPQHKQNSFARSNASSAFAFMLLISSRGEKAT